MDIEFLKKEVWRMIKAIEKDGKTFDFFALTPVFPGMADTSYIILIQANWATSFADLDYIINKMFEVLPYETRLYLNRVGWLKKKYDEILPMDEDLFLINKIGYKPDWHRYYLAKMAAAEY